MSIFRHCEVRGSFGPSPSATGRRLPPKFVTETIRCRSPHRVVRYVPVPILPRMQDERWRRIRLECPGSARFLLEEVTQISRIARHPCDPLFPWVSVPGPQVDGGHLLPAILPPPPLPPALSPPYCAPILHCFECVSVSVVCAAAPLRRNRGDRESVYRWSPLCVKRRATPNVGRDTGAVGRPLVFVLFGCLFYMLYSLDMLYIFLYMLYICSIVSMLVLAVCTISVCSVWSPSLFRLLACIRFYSFLFASPYFDRSPPNPPFAKAMMNPTDGCIPK